MKPVRLIEENKKLKTTLEKINNWNERHTAKKNRSNLAKGETFFVLKQFNGTGPIYKTEVCSKTLTVVTAEIIKEIPEGWSADDFYSLLDEGNRLDLDFISQTE